MMVYFLIAPKSRISDIEQLRKFSEYVERNIGFIPQQANDFEVNLLKLRLCELKYVETIVSFKKTVEIITEDQHYLTLFQKSREANYPYRDLPSEKKVIEGSITQETKVIFYPDKEFAKESAKHAAPFFIHLLSIYLVQKRSDLQY